MPLLGISTSSTVHASTDAHPHSTASADTDSDSDEDDPDVTTADPSASSSSEVLGLPSDFPTDERNLYGLEILGQYEAKLRIGQAFDYLENLREAVKHLSAFIDEKKENSHAVADNIRSNDVSKYSVAYCQHLAKRYNHVFDRIIALCGDLKKLSRSDPASRLQRINLANDLKITNLKKAREEGDHARSGSWIWAVFEDAMDCVDVDSAPQQPVDRAQWFRAWQEKMRYDEAVNILCAEFRATVMGFAAMADLWKGAAERDDLDPGERAYAWQHHAMFERMRKRAQTEYDLARKNDVPHEQLDHTRVSLFPSLATYLTNRIQCSRFVLTCLGKSKISRSGKSFS
ncbi:hypothetical protein LXA43DRAFT_894466 [Ganoderma leucocontextum]|nr:hypothetical protein LXA43DRAFT_894466 [Ganoderma leucocontextum]